MNQNVKIIFAFCIAIFLFAQYSSASSQIENLKAVVHKPSSIEQQVIAIQKLHPLLLIEEPDSAYDYAIQSLFLAKKTQNTEYQINAHINLSEIMGHQGNYQLALAQLSACLNMIIPLKDTAKIALIYNKIGSVNYLAKDYERALKYIFEALQISEQQQDEQGISESYFYLGKLYAVRNNFTKALDYFNRSLEIKIKTNDLLGSGKCHENIGEMYLNKNNFKEALVNFNKAESLYKTLHYQIGLAKVFNDLAQLYISQKQYPEAIGFYQKAASIHYNTKNSKGLCKSNNGIGQVYLGQKQLNLAQNYFQKAYFSSKKLGLANELKKALNGLLETAKKKDDFKTVFQYQLKLSLLKDSIAKIEADTKISKLEIAFDKVKNEKEIAILSAQTNAQKVEINTQNITNYILAGVLIGLFIISLIVFFAYQQNKKRNVLLDEKNQIIAKKNDDIIKKNKDITNSIRYAKRIQEATLPDNEKLTSVFPENFILFQPKDIVSGDFYWFDTIGDKFVMAVADCTGHGVPGAFMSLIGTELLSDIIRNKKVLEPSKILELAHQRIIKSLNKEYKDSLTVDGMDIVICVFDTQKNTLEFSGAGNPILLINQQGIDLIKSAKAPLGLITRKKREFTTTHIQLEKGDLVYAFTDGYIDQFGGENDERLTRANFIQLIEKMQTFSAQEQVEKLESFFEFYKGKNTQLDDICIIGIRV